MAESTVVNINRRGTRPRGEQTRQKILDATLSVIAREGVRGTTHRAIAKEADVQLSLTTYYFRDLNELISLAFQSFMDQDYGDTADGWRRAFSYLDQFTAEDLADAQTRDRIVDYCSKRIVDHIRRGLLEYPKLLAFEHHFFYEALNDDRLQELSHTHRKRLLMPLVRFCEYFSAEDPETDARLLFGTITRLEHQELPHAPDDIDFKAIRNEIRRMVSWIVNSN
ncbi:MAG: TetR family transcriptional regulator [Gammaproteobacteria bacterium]|nr:TetR family transcriptional regulator [Gammaproteobacteria bacterium]